MKRLFVISVLLGLFCVPLYAQTYDNTLYNQEGTASDGYTAIDASGQGPNGDLSDNYTNWKWQYGSATWAGVYSWDSDAWITMEETGDENLEIECDIEMYCATTIENNKMYFHIGDPFNATTDDLRGIVGGSMACNNGMYIGISFEGMNKTEADFEKDGGGNFTGRIFDAMVGSVDCGGRDISGESFDLEILMTWGAGWTPPDAYGDGAHGTIHDTLWWLVDGGNAGTYNIQWRVSLMPTSDQPDGNYYLDPVVVYAPEL